MSTQSFLSALVAAAISFSAIAHAQAGEMSSHKHAARAATAHAPAKTWRRSYARMPVESEAPQMMSSPNLFETGRPPAQPGPAH